jgi:hypothetical protein
MAAPLWQDVVVPQGVYIIWAILLFVAVFVVLPVVVFLLHRTWLAARSIERYFAEMAAAGVGIAENTSHIKALEDTIAVATAILGVAGNINDHTNTIMTTLATRASGNGHRR